MDSFDALLPVKPRTKFTVRRQIAGDFRGCPGIEREPMRTNAAQVAPSTIRASNPVSAPGGGENSASCAPCFSTMVLTIERPSP